MCIFCKIVKQELPAFKVYEDDLTLAFLDIKPVTAGHLLVIPKEHYSNLEAIPAEVLTAVISTVKKMGAKLKANLGVAAYNVIENNDPVAGQIIPHLHFHLIPRQKEDGLYSWPGREYQPGEAAEILNKLTS
ncbi:MAG: HIT family protein [Patescibacteria group bacterium]|jgi:histidine triad (HIT) family protein